MLTWFFLEVWIGKNEYFPMCSKSTVMQVMYYYCFILLDLANNVIIFPLRAGILSCLGHNLANSILSGSSGDEREGPTALFFGRFLTPWPLGFLHRLAVGGLRKAGQRGGHLVRRLVQ